MAEGIEAATTVAFPEGRGPDLVEDITGTDDKVELLHDAPGNLRYPTEPVPLLKQDCTKESGGRRCGVPDLLEQVRAEDWQGWRPTATLHPVLDRLEAHIVRPRLSVAYDCARPGWNWSAGLFDEPA